MRYSYDRTAAIDGPLHDVLVNKDWWNRLHDLEDALDRASFHYDRAASYNGGDGEKDAKAALKKIEEVVKKVKDLTSGNRSEFEALIELESDFVKKHGTIDQYVKAQQDRMGFR